MAAQFAGNVIFDIEIDMEKDPGLIFADIADVSLFDEEQEVLFDLSTVFRIKEVSGNIIEIEYRNEIQ